ncbi:11166_t:CDS:1, partial [Dentiscutata erythropus]
NKLEEGTAYLLLATNNENSKPEDELAEVVAHKTKKSRKRIRAQAHIKR